MDPKSYGEAMQKGPGRPETNQEMAAREWAAAHYRLGEAQHEQVEATRRAEEALQSERQAWKALVNAAGRDVPEAPRPMMTGRG